MLRPRADSGALLRGRSHEEQVNPILVAAVLIVQLALIGYTAGILIEQKKRRATRGVLSFLTLGVILDVTSTACMILGSSRDPWTVHGMLGYSALAAMLVDTVLIWGFWQKAGEAEVPRGLHLYSRCAYLWWIVAYLTGAALVVMSRRAGGA